MANKYRSVLASGGGVQPTGNAAPADVLSGKTFSNADGIDKTGTMVNNGAVSGTATPNHPYTIPAGYHNGSGTVTAQNVIPAIELNGASNASCNYIDIADIQTKGYTTITVTIESGSGTANLEGGNSIGAATSGRIGQATASTPFTVDISTITVPYVFYTVSSSGSTVSKLTIS